MNNITYAEARDLFLDRAVLSHHTKGIYGQAITHLLDYVEDASAPSLTNLGDEDAGILAQFASWLLNDCEAVAKASTARAYASGVARWLRWLADYGYLPASFPLNKARRLLSEALRSSLFRSSLRPPEPPDGIEELITFYDTLLIPDRLKTPAARTRWAITNVRNRALMRVLAETGGHVSEIVSLNVGDFPTRAFGNNVWRVWVDAKAGHDYPLRFLKSLPSIHTYLEMRRAVYGAEADAYTALFIRHTPASKGKRMTRNDVWHVVAYTACALGLGKVHPHDFRHWCGTQLIKSGVPLEIVREYLGHRSVQTTESYYAHISHELVDQAVRNLLED